MRGLTITQLGGGHPAPAEAAARTATLSTLDRADATASAQDRVITGTPNPTSACSRCGGWDSAAPGAADLPDDDGYYVPEDLYYPTDPDVPGGPVVMTAQEWL